MQHYRHDYIECPLNVVVKTVLATEVVMRGAEKTNMLTFPTRGAFQLKNFKR